MAKYASKQLKKEFRKGNYDCIFIIGSLSAAYLDINCPIVVLSDAVFANMIDYYWFNLSEKTIREGNIIEQKLFDNADKIILTSKWAADAAKKHYMVKDNQIELIHFGPNIDTNCIRKTEKHNSVHLLFVGVDWERKGGDIAVECIKILNKTDRKREYYLDAVGGRPEKEAACDYVKFWGFLNNNIPADTETLNQIRNGSDLFLLPTRAECSAIVFCEAAAFSLPVITYDTGGNRDYVIEGYNGICLPLTSTAEDFANAVLEIVQDKEKFEAMKENAHDYYLNELNWDIFSGKVKKCIDALINKE